MLASLVAFTLLRRFAVSALAAFVSTVFPLFDASPYAILDPTESWLQWLAFPLLRWDTFHFLHLAQNGPFTPVYEHEWAFFPAAPLAMRLGSAFISSEMSPASLLVGGMLIATVFDVGAVILLHRLTYHVFRRSERIADLTALLSLLSTSPAVLHMAPYSEPMFACFSFGGMLYGIHRKFFLASLCFSFAALCRSNGIFLAGFILWPLLIQPALDHHRLPTFSILARAVVYSAIPLLPFVYHHWAAWSTFCHHEPQQYSWCQNVLPLIYPAVQAKYWNSGFLRYWTPQQLPNFLIAGPPLLLLFTFSSIALRDSIRGKPTLWVQSLMIPQALYALFMALLLLFASHTQIVLRVGPSFPLLHWGVAWLWIDHPKWGKRWLVWSTIWGVGFSVALWATFLPPA